MQHYKHKFLFYMQTRYVCYKVFQTFNSLTTVRSHMLSTFFLLGTLSLSLMIMYDYALTLKLIHVSVSHHHDSSIFTDIQKLDLPPRTLSGFVGSRPSSVPCLTKEIKHNKKVPQGFRFQREHLSVCLKCSKNKISTSAGIKYTNTYMHAETVYITRIYPESCNLRIKIPNFNRLSNC